MPSSHARNVALTPELSGFVDEQVVSGRYASASEVMRAGLRALQAHHDLDVIATRVAEALDQLDSGHGITGTLEQVLGDVLDAARTRRG
ncbi:MAG: type II toxin-antitoxin system ParD family antitoxin [Gammaproteobacteria bacterium]|nr:type II toxin-antitoxin system ParD family antitoxin [Gammaproteobacteria bacterium]